MSSTICSLPDELLHGILLELPEKDIKAARVTCTRLAGNGAHHLFKSIYFAPRRKVMRDFKNITDHPIFGKSVEELVYDFRLFIGHKFHGGDRFRQCVSRCTRVPRPVMNCGWVAANCTKRTWMDTVEVARIYNGFYADQQAIFERQEDFQLLCDGLKRMPKLSTLTLWDDFERNARYNCRALRAHEWYVKRSLVEFGISLHPSSWTTMDDALQVEDASTKIRVLNFGVGLPTGAVLPAQTVTESQSVRPLLSNQLTTLRLQIEWDNISGNFRPSQQHSQDRILSSRSLLSSSKLLEHLVVVGEEIQASMGWISCFEGLCWPQLKILKLDHLDIEPKQLKDFLYMHRHSLRDLAMSTVCILSGISDVVDWDTVTKELGEYLSLPVVSLSNLKEDGLDDISRPGVPESEHYRVLVGNLMGQHPHVVILEEVHFRDLIATARRT